MRSTVLKDLLLADIDLLSTTIAFSPANGPPAFLSIKLDFLSSIAGFIERFVFLFNKSVNILFGVSILAELIELLAAFASTFSFVDFGTSFMIFTESFFGVLFTSGALVCFLGATTFCSEE